MRKLFNIAVASLALVLGVWIAQQPTYAKPEFAMKEGKVCTFCHPPDDTKSLTDAGKYYKAHGFSLDGYKPKQ